MRLLSLLVLGGHCPGMGITEEVTGVARPAGQHSGDLSLDRPKIHPCAHPPPLMVRVRPYFRSGFLASIVNGTL